MSEVTKAVQFAAVGAVDDESTVRKVVMYVVRSNTLSVPPRRIVHGKISYSKRMA